MTDLNFTRPADAQTVALADRPLPPMPQPTPGVPFPTPWPGAPTYSATDLMGEVYFGLWGAGKIPPGPMVDPDGAVRACADLLRAFGVVPTEAGTAAEALRAADAVAAVCGVAA